MSGEIFNRLIVALQSNRFIRQVYAERDMADFTMKNNRYKIALYPAVVSGNTARFSEKLDSALFETAMTEGFIELKNPELEKKLGITNLNRKNCFGDNLTKSTCICTPSVNDFERLEKLLAERIKIADETAKELDVKLSCIPVFGSERLTVPFMVFSEYHGKKQYNYFSEPAYTRNSIDISNPEKYEDYFINLTGHHGRGKEIMKCFHKIKSDMLSVSIEREFNGMNILDAELINMALRMVSFQKIGLPYYPQSQMFFSNLIKRGEHSRHNELMASVDEIMAHAELTANFNTCEKKEGLFENSIFSFEEHSLAFDKVPKKVILDKSALRDFDTEITPALEELAIMKNQQDKLIEWLEEKGYVEIIDFDKYFKRLTKDVCAREKSLEIIRKDFPAKYGTNRIRELLQNNSYEEVMAMSWDNLVRGKRWIK